MKRKNKLTIAVATTMLAALGADRRSTRRTNTH